MDNLTHTIIGLIAGESVARGAAAPAAIPGDQAKGLSAGTRRVLVIVAFAVGGNLPDLDLLVSYRGFTRGKLDYLLQHRGYTHTVLGCIALALILYGALELWMRWRRAQPTKQDRRLLLSAALFGTLLHLAMDFLNSYGVHPFWPVVNRWYYGDSVFIVEPLYWIAAAPLFFVQRSWPARAFVGFTVTAAIVLGIFSGLVPLPIVIFLIALAAALFVVGARMPASSATFASLAVYLTSTALFIACGGAASAASIRLAEAARLPATSSSAASEYSTVVDHVLTPMPANPICWDLILLEEQAGRLRLRHALISIAPRLISAAQCPIRLAGGITTAQLRLVPSADTPAVRWLGELEIPAQTFAKVAAQDCGARALMRFARAPFVARFEHFTVIGDLRFDREPGLGLAELAVPDNAIVGSERNAAAAATCPPTPPWTPPRAELLR